MTLIIFKFKILLPGIITIHFKLPLIGYLKLILCFIDYKYQNLVTRLKIFLFLDSDTILKSNFICWKCWVIQVLQVYDLTHFFITQKKF